MARALRRTCTVLAAVVVGLLGTTTAHAATPAGGDGQPRLSVTVARMDATFPAVGSVSAAPLGSVCSPATPSDVCAPLSLPAGSVVTLTATAGEKSVFLGWGGACIGNALTCTVTMDRDQPVTALFGVVAPDAPAPPAATTPPLLSPLAP